MSYTESRRRSKPRGTRSRGGKREIEPKRMACETTRRTLCLDEQSPNSPKSNKTRNLGPAQAQPHRSVGRGRSSRSRSLSSGSGSRTHGQTRLGGGGGTSSSTGGDGRIGTTGGFELECLGFGVHVGRVQDVGELCRDSPYRMGGCGMETRSVRIQLG